MARPWQFRQEWREERAIREAQTTTARRRMLQRLEGHRDPTVTRRLAFAEVLNGLAGDDVQPQFMPWFFGVG